MGLGLIMLALGIPNIRSLVYFLGANDDCAVYAMQYAQYVLLAAPFMVGSFIFNMCLKSEGSASIAMIGIGKAALALSTARQGYLLIPLLYIMPALMGVNGLASARCGADVLSLLITVPLAIRARKLIGAEMNA